MNKGRQTRR
jgi:hypothetical protein